METLNTADVSNSYFKFLPDEILLNILELLNTVDVFHFCECYTQYEYFFRDKRLSSAIDLSSGFKKIHSLTTIIEKFNPELVTFLDLTNITWIGRPEMRECLKKFKNLEDLSLGGTKVGISDIDGESYGSEKLRRLAITVRDKDLKDSQARFFPNVKTLCLHILSKKDYTFQFRLESLIKKLKELTSLWVYDTTNSYPIDYDHLIYRNSHLIINALWSMSSDPKLKGLTKIYVCKKSGIDVYCTKSKKLRKLKKIL